jgi:translation initiation factor 2B subunit (eIF-2B alpha/beta/delta family)
MKKTDKELEIILNDKVHGSTELLNLICQHLLKYQDNTAYLKKVLNRINKSLSHFPVIINFTKDVENILNGKKQDSLSDYLRDFDKKKNEVYQIIFKKASEYLSKHKTVLTISHSKTLIKIFELWKKTNPNLKVIVCESRPNQEGILMAMEILGLKIKTEIITEGMAGKIIKEVDVIILGADQVLRNGNIINKTGSSMLAILAKYQKIPVYVLASSDKTVNEMIIKPDAFNENEVVLFKGNRLKFRNENFEEVENKLITKIFTD